MKPGMKKHLITMASSAVAIAGGLAIFEFAIKPMIAKAKGVEAKIEA